MNWKKGLCIICQQIKKVAPTGTEKGRKSLLEFAKGKKDEVYERIKSTESEKTFLYHSGNLCYKPYVLAKAEPKMQDIKEIEDDDEV